VIDVSWCVSADHGGIPQFRLCDDEGLVSAVTTPDKPPSLADLEALEQCFQRGLLRCDDVDGNDCSQVEDGSGGVTLSMAQWSWADKSESSAALAPGACRNGGDWDSLSESGEFLRAYVREASRA